MRRMCMPLLRIIPAVITTRIRSAMSTEEFIGRMPDGMAGPAMAGTEHAIGRGTGAADTAWATAEVTAMAGDTLTAIEATAWGDFGAINTRRKCE